MHSSTSKTHSDAVKKCTAELKELSTKYNSLNKEHKFYMDYLFIQMFQW